jgi:hypothetical protein
MGWQPVIESLRPYRSAALFLTVVFLPCAQASGTLLQLSYSAAKVFGAVHIAGGAIDVTTGAMIVTTSSFGFVPLGYVPTGGSAAVPFPGEIGGLQVAEFGDNAIHDALIKGANFVPGLSSGYWEGTNGVMSSSASSDLTGSTAVGWFDNRGSQYTTWWGLPISPGQSIITYDYYGDCNVDGGVDARDLDIINSSIRIRTRTLVGPTAT